MVRHKEHSLKELRSGDKTALQRKVEELTNTLALTLVVVDALLNNTQPAEREIVAFKKAISESEVIQAMKAPATGKKTKSDK